MKKLTLLFLLITNIVLAQKWDTIIKNNVYSSYFSKKLHQPVFVVYKLYKGGGDCSRSEMRFKVDEVKNTATDKDYRHSGFDQGHLANAEDFAYDCNKEEKTFRFYNCVPQDPHLNRGVWKYYENRTRDLSQTDSLLIITGSVFGIRNLPGTQVAIPTYCWKVVQSLRTKKIYYSFVISNDDRSTYVNTDIKKLEKWLKYKLPLR
jgi:DNA/RNA endonuclease G (NUC1)